MAGESGSGVPAFSSTPPQPVAFEGMVGWLHPAPGRRAVVICNALGYYALACRPALRALADALAQAGLPCLRFDYVSEGDSLGSASDPGRVAAWIDNAVSAVDFMRSLDGVEEVALIGMDFGALAAQVAAARRGEFVRRAVWLAPVNGRALVRQMRADAVMAATELNLPAVTPAGDLCFAGFGFSTETLDALAKLKFSVKAAPEALLILAPNEAAWRDYEGGERCVRKFLGHSAMRAASVLPHIPHEDWRRIVDWLIEGAPPSSQSLHAPRGPALLAGSGFRELASRFGPDNSLAGVLCEPDSDANDACVIFLNSGANSHIGWGRASVALARRLAREARISTLRMDLRGLGESASLPGGAGEALYNLERVEDVREAVAFLKGRGYRRFMLVGQCSGAYLSLHAALHVQDVSGIVLVNLLRFTWRENETLEEALASAERSTDGYIEMLRSGEAWRRVIRGDAPPRRILRAARKFLHRFGMALADAMDWILQAPPPEGAPEEWLHRLSRRGVLVRFLFSANDSGLDEFAQCLGRGEWRIRRIAGLQKVLIQGADHNLTSAAAQESLYENIVAIVKG